MLEFVANGKLLLHVGGKEHDPAEVGEDGGVVKGDTVLRDGDKQFAKDVVDVGGGEVISAYNSVNQQQTS